MLNAYIYDIYFFFFFNFVVILGCKTRGRAVDELSLLLLTIGNFSLCESNADSWYWSLDYSGMFSVKSLSLLVQRKLLDEASSHSPFIWNSWVLGKVNICVWRALLNRLPTRDSLSSRGISLASSLWPLCGIEAESVAHCVLNCHMIRPIWSKVCGWWSMGLSLSSSLEDLFAGHLNYALSKWDAIRFSVECVMF